MKKGFLNILLYGQFLLFLTNPAHAVMVARTTEDLTRGSELVIRGTVEEVVSSWNPEHTGIHSQANVAVSEILRGTCSRKTVTVEYLGGTIDQTSLKVSDAPRLVSGEEVILFLKSGRSNVERNGVVFNIVGRAQGKYTLGSNGVARKSGFTTPGRTPVDSSLDTYALINKIKNIR